MNPSVETGTILVMLQQFEVDEKNLPRVAKRLVSLSQPGDIIALSGNLASGKTTLTREILRQLGYRERVSSPTFVIEHRYPLTNQKFDRVINLDFYRLSPEQLSHFDWADYLENQNQLTIVEWPEIAQQFLPPATKQVTIEKIDERLRRFTLSDNFSHQHHRTTKNRSSSHS